MSKIIDKVRESLHCHIDVALILEALNYAEELEETCKCYGCETCAHESLGQNDEPCRECIEGKPVRRYSKWELAPKN